jgi:2-aminoadipate transaminase
MLTGLGLRAVSLPTDASGLLDPIAIGKRLDELRSTGEINRVKAVYFVSYFSNPSGRSLTTGEKDQLAEVLKQKGVVVPVIEDAAYRELYFEEPDKTPSVLGLTSWKEFPKLYTSTLTKPFASGLKIGFGVGTDQAWLDKILHAKGHHDFGSANFNQAICETVLANGDFDRQLAKVRKAYLEKRDALDRALEQGGLRKLGWSWARPKGGLYLWLQAPRGIDLGLNGEFCHACIKEGVLYVPGDLCFGDFPSKDTARLSFGVLSPDKLAIAGERFCRVAHQFR